MNNDKEIKSCETCKYRGDTIGNTDWLFWCEAKKNCVDGSAWERNHNKIAIQKENELWNSLSLYSH